MLGHVELNSAGSWPSRIGAGLDTPGLYQYLTPTSMCLCLSFGTLSCISCLLVCLSFCLWPAYNFFCLYDICVVPDADVQKEEENSRQTSQRPSITDLDNIFGPEDSPKPGQDTGDKWVCFSEESPERLPPSEGGEPVPPLLLSQPPPAEPALPVPPLPKSPPPSEELNPPLPKSPPPPAELAPSPPSSESQRESPPPVPPVPKDTTPSPPTVPPPPVEEAPPPPTPDDLFQPNTDFLPCAPLTETRSDSTNSPPTTVETSARTIPPPLVLNQEEKKSPDEIPSKEEPSESSTSPKEICQGTRSTPPPPPPPTYRAVVSSPGPIPSAGTGENESGKSDLKKSLHRTLKGWFTRKSSFCHHLLTCFLKPE